MNADVALREHGNTGNAATFGERVQMNAQQKVDGGWGWFPQDDSNPIVTAYALIGLVEAQRAGFTASISAFSIRSRSSSPSASHRSIIR